MAIIDIPTGNPIQVIVESLPAKGEENTIYGVPTIEFEDIEVVNNYIWYDNDWHDFSFDAIIYGGFFERYQESVQNTVSEMEQTITSLETTIAEQSALIQELEEAVFPKEWVSFEMSITSLVMTHLDLYDELDNLVEEGAFTTDIYEHEPMTFQTQIKKGTYFLKNNDGYALGKPNGDIKPLVYDEGTTVDLGDVEIVMTTPPKGDAK